MLKMGSKYRKDLIILILKTDRLWLPTGSFRIFQENPHSPQENNNNNKYYYS
jgi:hypothetical protein